MSKICSMDEALGLIHSGNCIASSGITMCAVPEEIFKALEKKFLETGEPKDLTGVFSAGQGNWDDGAWVHLTHKGLLKRVVGGHYGSCPKLGDMVSNNELEAYNLPQGVILSMFRNAYRGRAGGLSKIGLKTFVDPRQDGGKLNASTTEDLVSLKEFEGEEWLYYKTPKIDVAIIRGSIADENGNISLEEEILPLDMRTVAMAAKGCGGKVIVQVKHLAKAGSLLSDRVSIPGNMVDAVVLCQDPLQNHRQAFDYFYEPSMSGHINVPENSIKPMALTEKKVISRRAAQELKPGYVVNLGIGTPEGVSNVAAEEGISSNIVLTAESGVVGGIPVGGKSFGAVQNAWCVVDAISQFDFYEGGGLNVTYLGLAQTNKKGDVNVSKFGTKVTGCGGFIDISQTTKKIVYCGTFTAGGLKIKVGNGKLEILQEGRSKKFVKELQQVTFSGEFAVETNQDVLYVTERAVFRLTDKGMMLIEIAPGVDLKKDVLGQMEFEPVISPNLKLMDKRLFEEGLIDLKASMMS